MLASGMLIVHFSAFSHENRSLSNAMTGAPRIHAGLSLWSAGRTSVHVHIVIIRRVETLVNRTTVVVVVDDLNLLPQAVDVTANLQCDLVSDLIAIEVERVEDFDPNVIGVDLDLLDARDRHDGGSQREGFWRILRGRFSAHVLIRLRLMAGTALNGVADAGNGADLVRRMPLANLGIREDLTNDALLNFGHLLSPVLV